MSEYRSYTGIQPRIPHADLTALEKCLFDELFRFKRDDTGTYFFSDNVMRSSFFVNIEELRKTMTLSDEAGASVASCVIRACLMKVSTHAGDVWLECPERFWEAILQDVVRRSKTLRYISLTTNFFHGEMTSDSPDAEVSLITADGIWSGSTDEMFLCLLDRVCISSPSVKNQVQDNCNYLVPPVFAQDMAE